MDKEIASILSKMSIAWRKVNNFYDFAILCDSQDTRLQEMEENGFDYRDYCDFWNCNGDHIDAKVRLGIITDKQGTTELRRMIYRLKSHIRNKEK